jgi:hypothetical protein
MSNKLNITPGPWYFSKGEFNGQVHDERAVGSIVSKCKFKWIICEVHGDCWEHMIDENKESYDNAAAIVTAVNNTYHKGINPEAVPEMLSALRMISLWKNIPDAERAVIKDIIQKATL